MMAGPDRPNPSSQGRPRAFPAAGRPTAPARLAVLTLSVAAVALLACNAADGAAASGAALDLSEIQLPEGFEISLYATDVPDARSMALSPSGVLYVGTRREGKVYALLDRDGDHRVDDRLVLAEGLSMPNGVAWREGSLYVAEVHRIWRYDGIDPAVKAKLAEPGAPLPEPVVIRDDYPRDRHHGWKFIAFGPHGWLYVPVGAPCNICDAGGIYSSITRIQPDGSEREIYAHGVRNTVGFDWHPESGVLWFTDNGRDMLGDDRPPDELNRAPEKGMHFGYPWCHGGDLREPELEPAEGEVPPCSEFTPPARKLGPHVAALGPEFYTGKMFPARYRNQLFIAEHGSWNRTVPIGYRVMLVRIEDGEATSYEPFAEGWLQGEEAWGRPVDLELLPDGSMLVSDDRAGVIYRITYGPEESEDGGEEDGDETEAEAEEALPEGGSRDR